MVEISDSLRIKPICLANIHLCHLCHLSYQNGNKKSYFHKINAFLLQQNDKIYFIGKQFCSAKISIFSSFRVKVIAMLRYCQIFINTSFEIKPNKVRCANLR